MAAVSEALQLAFHHHRANRLTQAEQVYRQILQQQPDQPDALYGLGVLEPKKGQHQSAESL